MRKIVEEYLAKPEKKLLSQMTSEEQRYVARVAPAKVEPKAEENTKPKKEKLTGIG